MWDWASQCDEWDRVEVKWRRKELCAVYNRSRLKRRGKMAEHVLWFFWIRRLEGRCCGPWWSVSRCDFSIYSWPYRERSVGLLRKQLGICDIFLIWCVGMVYGDENPQKWPKRTVKSCCVSRMVIAFSFAFCLAMRRCLIGCGM
jgi:hypothetical protein